MATSDQIPNTAINDKTNQEYRVPSASTDVEKQRHDQEQTSKSKKSVYAGLGWLDRLLVLWIFLAIVIGILLGNFVASVGPALQKGKFVQVSVPICMLS